MAHLGHHLRLRLADDRVIATTVEQRRTAVRAVLRRGRPCNLLCLNLADSHLHLQAVCSRYEAGQLARNLGSSLKQRLRLSVGFTQYEPVPIRDQHHLRNGFRYVLGQQAHHGLPVAQALEASNAPDLLGLRPLGAYTLDNVRRFLPRVTRADVIRWSGLPEPRAADGPLDQLEEATRAAACLSHLRGRAPRAVAARRALVAVIGDRRTAPELATQLGVSPRAIRWLRSRPADPALVEAIRLQLGTRSLCDVSALG